MPTGLTQTSDPIAISARFVQSNTNAFEVKRLDLQLNPLDQEVFVITAVKVDFLNMPGRLPHPVNGTFVVEYEAAVAKNLPTAMVNIGQSNCVAYSSLLAQQTSGGSGTTATIHSIIEQGATDAPPATMDYLDIVATSDLFLCLDTGGVGPTETADVAFRIYGYRARASKAGVYAALVQSEQLSL
tara:strand:- start:312 stop:866 length:555 start_codon:yes stop_codon:yes gene_type:complete